MSESVGVPNMFSVPATQKNLFCPTHDLNEAMHPAEALMTVLIVMLLS